MTGHSLLLWASKCLQHIMSCRVHLYMQPLLWSLHLSNSARYRFEDTAHLLYLLIYRTSIFHIWTIDQIRSILSQSDVEKRVHASVTSRLDDSNLLLIRCWLQVMWYSGFCVSTICYKLFLFSWIKSTELKKEKSVGRMKVLLSVITMCREKILKY